MQKRGAEWAILLKMPIFLKTVRLTNCSLLIKENQIAARQTQFKRYKLIKMNTEAFIMTPSFVLLDSKIPLNTSFQEFKKYMIDQFIMKGCTTLFTYISISYENELNRKIKGNKNSINWQSN